MKATDQITISSDIHLEPSTSPVVVIGANGTGKSMLGVSLANHGASRISARRALDIPDTISLKPLPYAQQELTRHSQEFATHRTYMANDLQFILTELNAWELEIGRQVREEIVSNLNFIPERKNLETGLDHVKQIWEALFPSRKLLFKGSEPIVESSHRGAQKSFRQNQMSDGERQALYLTAKIATIPDGSVIVVDEPETHLHPTLARRLWDLLQEYRPQSRFIYITHDLLFALSRRSGSIIVCRADGKHELVSEVPEDVTTEILGAASMPLMLERVIFCEGKSNSRDIGLFDAWFKDSKMAVFPVGGCDGVVKSIQGIRNLPSLRATVSGIVDRDERCKSELDYLASKNIHVLPVAEIEHLYCLPGVLRVVLHHLGKTSDEEVESALQVYKQKLVQHFTPGIHRLALQRAQDRIRWELRFPLDDVNAGANTLDASANLSGAYNQAISAIEPAKYFSEAERVVKEALAGSIEDILKELPSKAVLGIASQCCGLSPDAYTGIVRAGICGKIGDNVKDALVMALQLYLPPRS